MQSRGAAIESNAVSGTAICRKAFLKSGDFRPENELTAVDGARKRGVNLRLNLLILRAQVEKRNHSDIHCSGATLSNVIAYEIVLQHRMNAKLHKFILLINVTN